MPSAESCTLKNPLHPLTHSSATAATSGVELARQLLPDVAKLAENGRSQRITRRLDRTTLHHDPMMHLGLRVSRLGPRIAHGRGGMIGQLERRDIATEVELPGRAQGDGLVSLEHRLTSI
jgi:hypothetical protein